MSFLALAAGVGAVWFRRLQDGKSLFQILSGRLCALRFLRMLQIVGCQDFFHNEGALEALER